MKRLLREPLVHFLAMGLALFVLFGLVGGADERAPDRIVVSEGRIAQFVEVFARTWQRPPTERELESLVDEHVREEIYYREALAMGLDRDDTVVRRRLRQKLEFVADELTDALRPTEEQLEAYLRDNPERFREPDRVTFRHVYLSPDRRGPDVARDAERLRARLADMPDGADLSGVGDRLMIPPSYERASIDVVGRDLGGLFADALPGLPIGRWSGPVESGFGLHLVRIEAYRAGSVPSLAAVRAEVEREWRAERRRDAERTFYDRLRARYDVTVEWPGRSAAAAAPDVAEARP